MKKTMRVFEVAVKARRKAHAERLGLAEKAYAALTNKNTRYAGDVRLQISFNREIVGVCDRYLQQVESRRARL